MFAGILVWRLLTNGGIVYVAMGKLGDEHYLDMSTGMLGYGISLGLAAAGFAMFYKNCDENFDRSTFYRPEIGKKYIKEWFSSSHVNNVKLSDKDEERWYVIKRKHPLYLPFDNITLWLCKDLVEKYEDKVQSCEDRSDYS